jgi:hypothetical protein
MVLEHHPVLHYLMEFLFYSTGVAINILAGAHIASQSKLNGLHSIKDYLVLRWVPICARYFVCICLFFILWENPHVLTLERFMPNFSAHLGVAGSLGWLSDSVWDKTMAILLPGLQKELPAVPDAPNTNPPS